jgi:hypothetical protein
LTELAEELK